MSEQEVREFEENIVKGANIAFQRLVKPEKERRRRISLLAQRIHLPCKGS